MNRQLQNDYSGDTRRGLRCGSWEIVETHHDAGSATDWHRHDRAHFCLVVAGEVEDGPLGHRWSAGPGTLLFFPAGVPHANRFAGSGARCLNLREGDRDRLSNLAALPSCPVPVALPEASWLAGQLYDATVEGDSDAAGPLADRLVRRVFDEGFDDSPRIPDWLDRARQIVETDAARRPQLADVARTLGVDRFRLARGFRARFGCSLGQYRHRLQVNRARHELLVTETPLATIAYRAGFADQSHFTRLFKRYTGMTPREFRHSAR